MMKNVVRALLLSAVVLTGLAVSAAAQNPAITKKTQVGFDFYVGDKLMPAGEYVLRAVSRESAHGIVMVEQVNGNAKIAVHTFPVRNSDNLKSGSLLFKKHGDNHYLSAFQLGNENYMHQILKNTDSRITKREATKKIAQTSDAKKAIPSTE